MFRKILVPVDFSEFSHDIVVAAAQLAGQFGSEIHLLHVIPNIDYFAPYESFVPVGNLEAMQKGVEVEVYKGLKELAKLASGIEVREVVRQGSAFVEIVDYVKEQGIDLVVIATHGRSGLGHVLIGSVAEKVVRRSPCPVLTMRAKGRSPKA